jgi:hypothetical protein
MTPLQVLLCVIDKLGKALGSPVANGTVECVLLDSGTVLLETKEVGQLAVVLTSIPYSEPFITVWAAAHISEQAAVAAGTFPATGDALVEVHNAIAFLRRYAEGPPVLTL